MAKKNAQLHIMIETHELTKLRAQAEEKRVSLAELCRVKLRNNPQFDRIEEKLDKILKKIRK